jgi:hypothetical protein
VLEEGFSAMDLDAVAAVGVALVPTGRGSMIIDRARIAAMELWARQLGPLNYFDGFFPAGGAPSAGVGAHRVALTSLFERDQAPSWQYAELFDDGAGFACRRLTDARTGNGPGQAGTLILNEVLLWELGRCLHTLGRHAVENCGAWGDALAEVRVIGPGMRLAYLHQFGGGYGQIEPIAGGRELEEATSRHTIVVEGASSVGQDLSAATRLLATDIFHAFGSPEVRQIAPDGTLRARYLPATPEFRAWAEARGIAVSEEPIAGE